MFTQEDPDASDGGLGIGLALVKELVQLHGGSVQAVSMGLGMGSEFTVRLPLHDSRTAAP
jgi:signal transduction histidine kinase